MFEVLIVGLVVLNSLVVMVELLLELGLLERSASDEPAIRVLAYANVAILALFVLEMGVKVPVYGKAMLRHRLEIFDATVVLVSFSLALALGGERKPTHPLGLLIILRLWRVTKILNSPLPLPSLILGWTGAVSRHGGGGAGGGGAAAGEGAAGAAGAGAGGGQVA